MRFRSVPLARDNIAACRPLWGDRFCYSPQDLDRTIAVVQDLLHQDRARGTLIVDEERRPRYFGLTVFVSDDAARALTTAPAPRLGARLLTLDGTRAILDDAGIARGNASHGLHMVVVNQGWDLSGTADDAWPAMMGVLLRDFEEVHTGFRLSAIIGEAFGEDGLTIVKTSGAYPHLHEFTFRGLHGEELVSVMFWLGKDDAVRGWSTLLPMFAYNPPQVFFTRLEQRLLREALSGATDATLARRLGMSLSAVKSLWMRAFERMTTRVPELMPDTPEPAAGHRGLQKRHIMLEFVRQHPAELTPYARQPDGRSGATRSSAS